MKRCGSLIITEDFTRRFVNLVNEGKLVEAMEYFHGHNRLSWFYALLFFFLIRLHRVVQGVKGKITRQRTKEARSSWQLTETEIKIQK